MYKALLIDLDGTLLNNLSFYISVYEKTLDYFSLKASKQEIARKFLGRKEIEVCHFLGISEKFEEYKKVYSQNKKDLFQNISPFPGAVDFLKKVKGSQTPIALNSIAHRWYVDMALEKASLPNVFDKVVSFEDVSEPKPSPEPVRKIEEFFGVSASEILVIGDGRGDIQMGKASGSKTVLTFPKENEEIYGADWPGELKADFVVRNFGELEKIIEKG